MIQHLTSNKQSQDDLVIVLTGDLVLDEANADHWLAGISPALREADVAIGHLEVPHTKAIHELEGDVPAPGADPDNLSALSRAGFNVVTLAGNHIADCGTAGILDTIAGLEANNIRHCGAGADLNAAKAPVVVPCNGRNLGILSYNCVGPANAWADADKAGCAYLPVQTEDGTSVAPAKTLTRPTAEAYAILGQDIGSLRNRAGLVVVALHKGKVHTPALVEDYEILLAHAAIDAGADIVVSHHAHIVRGIEFYKGKPIFHGLGNGCVVTRALDPAQHHAKRAEWAQRRKILFGFEPDPAYYLAPFHPEAVNAFMARIVWRKEGEIETGILPVFVDPPGRPRLADRAEAARICNYLQNISQIAGLAPLTMNTRTDMVQIS